MLELGPRAGDLHAALAPALRNAGIDLVFTAGALMERLHQELPRGMRGGHARDATALAPIVAQTARAGDVVAVKGSHGSRMSTVVTALAALHKTPPPTRAANGD
jgi:UDP-N-acetylmuramoyl-tripeptide--D-alanyl-D-alanine ligase